MVNYFFFWGGVGYLVRISLEQCKVAILKVFEIFLKRLKNV